MNYQEAIQIIKEKSCDCNRTFLVSGNEGVDKTRLFISTNGKICRFMPRSQKRGYSISFETVSSWKSLIPVESVHEERKMVEKFKRYASKATFPSAFVRKCINADVTKGCYENHLTTGCGIDGQIITMKCIEKYAPYEVKAFQEALQSRTPYHSYRFPFQGYEGTLWIEIAGKDNGYNKTGDVNAGFSKEYIGCGNGYYYALINEDAFIGIDKD
ncbi:hypothetical protein [Bacteroides cellulosilyticus]|uniref:hypothetical protein n=1 Tax=Bacteroides cellulosilyticus TaxID=246787 RepID=UPI0022E5DBE4|nr:hypothetical protein [Bacteroides cellulosilyticus]